MYKDKIRKLKREIILETRKSLISKRIESICLTPSFRINNEQKVGDEYIVVPLIVQEVDIYGSVTTVDYNDTIVELSIEELDVYDLAHLHERITKNGYKVILYQEDVETTKDPSV